jgi:cell division inhibitor SepF
MTGMKIVDKMLNFMGFEEEVMEENEEEKEKNIHEEPREEHSWLKKKDKEKGAVISMHAQRQVRVVVIEPRAFEEAKGITDNLKNRRPVIVNLEQAESELAQRVVDFVSGATYALNGSMQKVGNSIFLFVPNNMDIASDFKEQGKGKSMFPNVRF